MNIKINGNEETIDGDSVTVSELLALKQVDSPEMVSVQLNGEFVDRAAFDTTAISEGNDVDFMYFMGGGA